MYVNNKEILGVVDIAAQVSVINSSLFEQIVPRPKLQGRIILKGADKFSEIEAKLAEQIKIQIGNIFINWNMVVADITDSVILGIYFLEKNRAVIDLSDYSIRLNGQTIPSVIINTEENQHVKYRVKTTKRIAMPPYTKQISIVEFDKEPEEDVVVQPTSFQNGLLIPNSLCPGKRKVPLVVQNPTENYKTIRKGCQIGVGIQVSSLIEEESNIDPIFELKKLNLSDQSLSDSTDFAEKLPVHMKNLFQRSCQHLTHQQSRRLAKLLYEFEDIFATDDLDIGVFNGEIEHMIDTGDSHTTSRKWNNRAIIFRMGFTSRTWTEKKTAN